MADNIVGCCSGSPCQSLANIAYIKQLINIGSAGCKPGVPQAPAIIDGCCVDSGDADEYVVKYGDFSSLSKRSTSENPVNDVSGYILGDPSSSNGCCPGSTAEYALNKGEVSFGYTTIESVDIQNAVFTDVCNGRVSYTKNDSWLRHERSCDSNGGVEETTTPVSYSTNVSTAITVTSSITTSDGNLSITYNGTLTASTVGCNGTKSSSTAITDVSEINFSISCPDAAIPCEGGSITYSITETNMCGTYTIEAANNTENPIYIDLENNTIVLGENENSVSEETITLSIIMDGVTADTSCTVARDTCSTVTIVGCSNYLLDVLGSVRSDFNIY